MPGNVIFSSARRWSKSLPVSGWNRKTEKARCNGERVCDDPGGGIRWPAYAFESATAVSPREEEKLLHANSQSFFEPSPMALSSLSRRINRSSMRLICSASYFVGSSVIVSDVRGSVWSAYDPSSSSSGRVCLRGAVEAILVCRWGKQSADSRMGTRKQAWVEGRKRVLSECVTACVCRRVDLELVREV